MLAQLIAAGVISAASGSVGIGPVDAAPERTALVAQIQGAAFVAAGIPLGATEWLQPYDPADHAPRVFDFSTVLLDGEKVADVLRLRVSPAGVALGIAIDATGPTAPRIDSVSGQKVEVWFSVPDAYHDAISFDASGVRLAVSAWIETDSVPPKKFERSCVLTVRQL